MRARQSTACFNCPKMLPRHKLILEFWDRKKYLTIKNKDYKGFVNNFFLTLLKSDIKNSDLTTNSLIPKNKKIFAYIAAKEDGTVAGLEEFKFLSNDLKISHCKKDGDKIKSGDVLVSIKGSARKIIARERAYLNLLQRMSGVATLVDSLNKKLNNKKTRIAATRKTLWGLLDKKAVSIGGGLTHRLNLNDGIIIKDNHLKILHGNIKKAVTLVKNKSRYVEIEAETKEQAISAANIIKNIKNKNKILFAVMLDKIQPDGVKSIIEELKNEGLYDCILLEASGNINQDNIGEYSDCGADIISMGCMTNSAKALDMSMEVR